jgi:hypothetical protein
LARLWLAIHERANFPREQQFGRFLSEADIIRQARPAELVENDPEETSRTRL